MNKDMEYSCRTGIIYRNPAPHIVSRHAYFPSVVTSESGEMLVSFAIGEAFEAVNLNTYISRSVDGGQSWTEPDLLIKEVLPGTSQFARLCYMGDGKVVANILRCIRTNHIEEGLANPANTGFVPTNLFLLHSDDFGRTWKNLKQVTPPLEGPCFEMCSALVRLADGTWVWPTSTWRDWNGSEPNGMKMVALLSNDQGKTWPEYWTVMDNHKSKIIYWESKIIQYDKETLLGIAWTYDEQNGKDLDIHYACSDNGGITWSNPASTGLIGQTVFPVKIAHKRVLTVYRRTDKPGLWAAISTFENGEWKNEKLIPLWGTSDVSLLAKSPGMVQHFNELKFGAPSVARLDDDELMIVFWCYENYVSNIRWIKIRFK